MIRRLRGESLANFDDNLPLTAFRDLRKAIEVLNEAGLYGPLLIQIYSTIDIMASLARPEYRPTVTRGDFKRWVERYIQLDGQSRITGDEWYAGRCAVLHTYGVETPGTRQGRIGYVVGGHPAVRFAPEVDSGFVLVDVVALCEAVLEGMNLTMIRIFEENPELAEGRLEKLFVLSPFPRG